MSKPPSFRRRPGFTLIELLVILSIVALLVSLLVPALSKAREAANRVICLTNQRSMGLAMMNFESDYTRMPNLKTAHSTYPTLEGQPWTDSSPGVNITSNYTGTEEYRVLLHDYMGAPIGPLRNGRHIYIQNWKDNHPLNCPSAVPNDEAWAFDDNFASNPGSTNPNDEFNKWGGLQMDFQPLGANLLYWRGNTPNYIPYRRSSEPLLTNPLEVVLVTEPCRLATQTGPSQNNHQGQGLNVIWYDMSGQWIPLADTVQAGHSLWGGGNRFGDPGITQYRIPKARWAQVGGGFRIQEFGNFYGNGNMNPSYPNQVKRDRTRIGRMGYSGYNP